MAEKCTNTSSPVERWIKPYPFAPLNHFTVPFSLTKKLLSPSSLKYSSVSLFVPGNQDTPSKDGKNSVAHRVRAKPHQHKRLPKFRHSTGSDETHGAANEGAISNGQTQNVNLDCTLANQCRLAKPKIIAGSGVLARGKLLKANYDPGPDIGSFREWTGY
jgi:hypothetical protein